MVKQSYKAILLVLASDNTKAYIKFREIYQAYYESNPEILVLLVYGKTTNIIPNDHDLVFDVDENYFPGMITKTILALEHIEKTYNYEYLIRTNISTFWVLDRLRARLDKAPATECFEGSIRFCSIKGGGSSPNYISGTNLVLSRDMVQKMLSKKKDMLEWDKKPEDWAMSQALIDFGYEAKGVVPAPIQHMDMFTEFNKKILQTIESADAKNRDNFRIKNKGDRTVLDISIANMLLLRYYGKTIL